MPAWRVEPRVAVWTLLHCKVQHGVGRTVQWPKTEVVTRLQHNVQRRVESVRGEAVTAVGSE